MTTMTTGLLGIGVGASVENVQELLDLQDEGREQNDVGSEEAVEVQGEVEDEQSAAAEENDWGEWAFQNPLTEEAAEFYGQPESSNRMSLKSFFVMEHIRMISHFLTGSKWFDPLHPVERLILDVFLRGFKTAEERLKPIKEAAEFKRMKRANGETHWRFNLTEVEEIAERFFNGESLEDIYGKEPFNSVTPEVILEKLQMKPLTLAELQYLVDFDGEDTVKSTIGKQDFRPMKGKILLPTDNDAWYLDHSRVPCPLRHKDTGRSVSDVVMKDFNDPSDGPLEVGNYIVREGANGHEMFPFIGNVWWVEYERAPQAKDGFQGVRQNWAYKVHVKANTYGHLGEVRRQAGGKGKPAYCYSARSAQVQIDHLDGDKRAFENDRNEIADFLAAFSAPSKKDGRPKRDHRGGGDRRDNNRR